MGQIKVDGLDKFNELIICTKEFIKELSMNFYGLSRGEKCEFILCIAQLLTCLYMKYLIDNGNVELLGRIMNNDKAEVKNDEISAYYRVTYGDIMGETVNMLLNVRNMMGHAYGMKLTNDRRDQALSKDTKIRTLLRLLGIPMQEKPKKTRSNKDKQVNNNYISAASTMAGE